MMGGAEGERERKPFGRGRGGAEGGRGDRGDYRRRDAEGKEGGAAPGEFAPQL